MSTRDEILAALTEHPQGLTSKELAPLCPAAECDPQIVGRVIAGLRAEDVIHPGTELRDGGAIWIFGHAPVEKREPALSLAGADQRPSSSTSEAAAAIARMRGGSIKTSQKPPAPAAPDQEPAMIKKTVAERCIEALKKHGQLTLDELAKHADTTKATLYTMAGTLKKKHGVISPERGVYALKAPPPQQLNERPAPAAKAKKEAGGSSYAAALSNLQEKRAGLSEEIAKIDRAIEAIEALA